MERRMRAHSRRSRNCPPARLVLGIGRPQYTPFLPCPPSTLVSMQSGIPGGARFM